MKSSDNLYPTKKKNKIINGKDYPLTLFNINLFHLIKIIKKN